MEDHRRRHPQLLERIGRRSHVTVVQAMLSNFASAAIRRVRDVLDIETLGQGLGGHSYA